MRNVAVGKIDFRNHNRYLPASGPQIGVFRGHETAPLALMPIAERKNQVPGKFPGGEASALVEEPSKTSAFVGLRKQLAPRSLWCRCNPLIGQGDLASDGVG